MFLFLELFPLMKTPPSEPSRPLPDEVIIDILSRFPAECVLKFRTVCKQWLVLTSSPYFTEMHLQRALPVLLVQNKRTTKELELFTINERAQKDDIFKKMKITNQDLSELICSCNGLLVFRLLSNNSNYVIFNPVTLERVTIEPPVPAASLKSSIFAIFFHRPTKDYRLLLWCQTSFDLGSAYKFFIYSCRTKVWRELATFNHVPEYLGHTVILNNALYWKTEYRRGNRHGVLPPCRSAIIRFDTDAEEFSAVSHPGTECNSWKLHERMILLEAKGWLCVCTIWDTRIDIKKLEDYKTSSWFYVVWFRIPCGLHFPNFDPTYFNRETELPDVRKQVRFVDWLLSGLNRHHLCDDAFEELKKATKGTNQKAVIEILRCCRTISYTKSFVSVTNL